MIKTKRDVFGELLDAYDEVRTGIEGIHPTVDLLDFSNNFEDALPDPLAEIQAKVGKIIKEYKANEENTLLDILRDNDIERLYFRAASNLNMQYYMNTIASAWIDGVWIVQETGEVVRV